MSDIEESLKRITSHNGVMGVAVLDDAGKLARYPPAHPRSPPRLRVRGFVAPLRVPPETVSAAAQVTEEAKRLPCLA